MRHITFRRALLVEGIIFVLLIVASFLWLLLLPPAPCSNEEPCARAGGLFFLWVLLAFGPAAGVAFGVAGTRGKLTRFSITLLVIVHLYVLWMVAGFWAGACRSGC